LPSEGGPGIDLVHDAVVQAGQERSQHQVGVRVGAGDAAFDPQGGSATLQLSIGFSDLPFTIGDFFEPHVEISHVFLWHSGRECINPFNSTEVVNPSAAIV
jgi:hypothetical protein